MYGQLIAFYEEFDREPSQHAKKEEERKLGTWCNNQRQNYKKGFLQKYTNRIKKLEKLGFVWYPFTDQWDEMYGQLIAFYEKSGKHPNQNSQDSDEEKLARWCGTQRGDYKSGVLQKRPDRIQKLEKIGFVWDVIETQWEEMYRKYDNFKKKYNREPTVSSKDKEEIQIRMWCDSQRSNYKDRKSVV